VGEAEVRLAGQRRHPAGDMHANHAAHSPHRLRDRGFLETALCELQARIAHAIAAS